MTATGIILIILAVAIGVLLIVFRKTLFIKLTWKYAIILIPVLFIIAAALFARKKPAESGQPVKPDDLSKVLHDTAEKLTEANMAATIEVTATRQQNKDKLEQLKTVTQIEDDTERRKQLAAMLGILIVCFFCFVHAQDYISFMPKATLNFDSLVVLPQQPGEILNPNLPDFVSQAIDSGAVCKTKHAILISEKRAAESIFYKAGYDRQTKELKIAKYLLNFHDSVAVAVEKNIYWPELKKKDIQIVALEKSNQRNWWERNNIWVGVVLGVAVAVITEYAVVHTAK